MSTRSLIGVQDENGNVEAVYCHFDGYPEHNGKILQQSWGDEAEIRKMISHGSMSALGNTLEECIFYARDRGESLEENSPVFWNVWEYERPYLGQEWEYIFISEKHQWYYKEAKKDSPLYPLQSRKNLFQEH